MKLMQFANQPGFDKIIRMIVLILCLLFLGGIGVYGLKTGKSLDHITAVIALMSFVVKDIISYDWGSSSGSKDKDSTIKDLLDKQNKP